MSSTINYQQGSFYEIFIKRAHRVYDGNSRNGGQGSYMKNLLDTADGQDLRRLAGTYEQQFAKVVGYMQKAIDKYLKMKLTQEERQAMELLDIQLKRATSAGQLMSIVQEGIEITQRLKN